MTVNVLVFDIETIPDVASGRRLLEVEHLSDVEVADLMLYRRRQESGSEFLRPHLHRIAAISIMLSSPEHHKVWSLGENDATEAELVQRFFEGVAKLKPTLVSWNGSGFDLPVLHYRALLHGIVAPEYWEMGENDKEFRYNNYLNRFHWKHIDLMDVLAGFQARAVAPLEEIATMLGLPGKMGMHGSKVWQCFQAGDLDAIRNYCETDVLNTYLVYLRFELMRGQLKASAYADLRARLRAMLEGARKPHLQAFLEAWKERDPTP